MKRILAFLVLYGVSVVSAAEAPKPGAVFKDCVDCPEMVKIPPGSFVMGSTADETTREGTPDRDAANEKPQHRVTIDYSFAVMKTEVIRKDFAVFVAATKHAMAEGCKIWEKRLMPGASWMPTPVGKVLDSPKGSIIPWCVYSGPMPWPMQLGCQISRAKNTGF